MNISLIKYPVTNLGPGNRIGIWTSGCHKNCKNCMSPHAKEFSKESERSLDDILKQVDEILSNYKVDGVTISGGEPFDQVELRDLLTKLREKGINDILVYTGYLVEELQNQKDTLKLISVLIDGPYVDELNDDKPLRGSSNQRIFIIDNNVSQKYLDYLKKPRNFDIYVNDDTFEIIGILPKGGYEFIKKII